MPSETPDPKTQAPTAGQGPQHTTLAGPYGGGVAPQVMQNVVLSVAPPSQIDTGFFLSRKPRLTVAFPPCSDELLALIKTTQDDDVTVFFNEYFEFKRHTILGQVLSRPDIIGPQPTPPPLKELEDDLPENLDACLLRCLEDDDVVVDVIKQGQGTTAHHGVWPTECCLCPPCVTLKGNRNPLPRPPSGVNVVPFSPPVVPTIRRLFIGDLLWLYYFERMGICQILGAILYAFACNGRLPISNGSLDLDIRDDIVALVLEVMVRQTKMGMASSVRDRNCAYRTCLGWTSAAGRKLNQDTAVNSAFTDLFHKLIFNALEFYKDKRLAVAIQGTATFARSSVATLITISDTIDLLKKRFETFAYGRNYYNTLSGIIWVIAGMSVIRNLRTTLGVPPAYNEPHEYIPAAYDRLVPNGQPTYGQMNRYDLHRQCAQNGRDILLDLEVINHLDKSVGGTLDNWLNQVEGKVEGYRTAFRTLTGVDLGATATPTVDQQVYSAGARQLIAAA